ncbi:hypothetical protein B0J14DRAFT_50159 [Halenospora varia]|nr:hypothetical protein B0J14DRAFT_50159 [Halenospora varia]
MRSKTNLALVSMVPNTSTTSYGNIHWMVPCAINNLFTGRAELLLRMQKALHVNHTSSANKQKRFVITGLGGQGKSEICLKVADLMREEFWGIFWVDVGRPATAESDFIAVAKTLGQPVDSVSNALQVLATTKQRWLLILDNADDPDFNYQVYLPSGTQGAIIITSRIPECRQYNTVGAEALEGLKDQYPRELLLKAAEFPPESWSSYNSQAEEVVRLLGSHTLALIQAGAYIAKGHCQLHQYPQFYRRQRKRLLKFRPKQAQSRYCDVYATFEASADVLEQSKSEAAEDALRLLEILSMLDSGILPLRIFEDAWGGGRNVLRTNPIAASAMDALSRGHLSRLPSFVVVDSNEWDPFRLLEASSLLVSLSLVTRHDLDGLPGLSMHPLTHAWAKVRQDLEQQCVAWITTGCVLALSQSNDHTWQTQERRLLPHMQSYLDVEISRVLPFGTEAIVVPILLKCGWNLQGMRQDSKLSHLLEDMFTELRKEPNEPSKESLPLYDLQARSLLNLGKNKKAMELLEQVVKIHKTTLAEDHLDRLASQHELASAYHANGQVKEAVDILEQVVKIQETTLAENHPDRLASQHELACAYHANGQVKEAVDILEQVVKIHKTTLAEDHPHRLASLHELARAYQANGQVKEAVVILEQVVKIEETTLAEDHPDRLASQQALALTYQANGQVKEVVDILEQVVKIKETMLAEDHPNRLASQHVLASAYKANGQVKEAVDILEHVVKIKETTLAEDHPSRLVSQHELARAYKANGQVREAVDILEQVVKIEETTLAEDHPDRLASQQALALTYQANGQVKEAVDILEQVVKIKETMLVEDHPNRLASQHVLASAYKANGQVKEAVDILEHVVKIKETTLAEDHPSRLASQHELARAYKANGQVREAVDILEHVVKIKETTLAEDHPSRLASQHALALAYHANGQVKEGVKVIEQVVKIKQSKLHKSHPSRVISEKVLAYFLREL